MDPIHFSNLKHMSQSPAHYLYSVNHSIEATRPMRIGSVMHALVLGGRYWCYDGERRGRAWKEFEAEHQDGATIVNASEYAAAENIAQAVLHDPVAGEVLACEIKTEQCISWTYLDRTCAGRVDIVGSDFVGELKVTNSADLGRFGWLAMRMAYHAQLAWYLRGLGRPLTCMAYIIAVEDKPPYPVTVRNITARALDYGDRLCRLWMERVLACEAANVWPGYAQSIIPLDIHDDEEQELIVDGEAIAL